MLNRNCVSLLLIITAVFQGCAATPKAPPVPFTKTYYIPTTTDDDPNNKSVTLVITKAIATGYNPDPIIIQKNTNYSKLIDAEMIDFTKQLETSIYSSPTDRFRTFNASISVECKKGHQDTGQIVSGSIFAGLTLGIGEGLIKIDWTYPCIVEMVVQRSDGISKTYSASASSKAKVSNNNREVEHLAIVRDAFATCMSQILTTVKADTDFWRIK